MTFKEHIASAVESPWDWDDRRFVTEIPVGTEVTFHRYCPGLWHFAFDGHMIGHVITNTDRPDRVWRIEIDKVILMLDIGQKWAYFESFKEVKEHIRRIVETQAFYENV